MPLSIIKQSKLQKGENDLEFKKAVVTKQGRELMAKLLAGKQTAFTKVKVSSTVYQDGQLENLTALTNIKQEATAQAYGNNTATISVTAAIENTGLQTGYYINTVGLYATDPDKGEILYSVSSAAVNGYMPPDTGVSKSGFSFKIYSEVGNASQVDLTVDPAAIATHGDIERLKLDVANLKEAWSDTPDGYTHTPIGVFQGPFNLIGTGASNQIYTLIDFKKSLAECGVKAADLLRIVMKVTVKGTELSGEWGTQLGSASWVLTTPNKQYQQITAAGSVEYTTDFILSTSEIQNDILNIRLNNVPNTVTLTLEYCELSFVDKIDESFCKVKPKDNLVRNSDFSSGTTGWTFSPTLASKVTILDPNTTFPFSGARALKIDFDATDTTTRFANYISAEKISELSKKSYGGSIWYYMSPDYQGSGIRVYLRVTLSDGTYRYSGSVSDRLSKGKWTRIELELDLTEWKITEWRITIATQNSSAGHVLFVGPKGEIGKPSPFVLSPLDNPEKAFRKYHGITVLDSENPSDYIWQMSDEAIEYNFSKKPTIEEFNDLASRLAALENQGGI